MTFAETKKLLTACKRDYYFHKQRLEKAKQDLENDPPILRSFNKQMIIIEEEAMLRDAYCVHGYVSVMNKMH